MLRRRRLDHILGTCLRRRRVETNRDVVLKLGQKIRADIGDPEIVNLTSLNAPATGMTFEAPCIRRGGRSMTTVSPGDRCTRPSDPNPHRAAGRSGAMKIRSFVA